MMNARDYIDQTKEISPARLAEHDALALYAFGVCGEAGEVSELIKKHLFHDQPLDLEKLLHEVGDVLWYLARLVDRVTYGEDDLETAMTMNIAKLRARHPNGWSSDYHTAGSTS